MSCGQRQKEGIAPWGETQQATDSFDLEQIVGSGELIALTLTGPDSYYDYHGRHLGTHYLLCQQFCQQQGISLRVEVCRDTAEMRRRLVNGEADVICYPLQSTALGWEVGPGKDALRQAIAQWYRPTMADSMRRLEAQLLSTGAVKRRVFSPMLNAKGGVISHYDALFQQHSRQLRWDWRLMAAQCYQESTFDPQAHSWAGACGLMQIMPATADHLGLARTDIYDPEKNIAAAARYLAELEQSFADVGNRQERLKFVLAAYNGGAHHVRDAMALAASQGRSSQRWADVRRSVLQLAEPAYYNDPVVHNGYMRGSETAAYVDRIMERWNVYRGVRVRSSATVGGTPQRAATKKSRYSLRAPEQ